MSLSGLTPFDELDFVPGNLVLVHPRIDFTGKIDRSVVIKSADLYGSIS